MPCARLRAAIRLNLSVRCARGFIVIKLISFIAGLVVFGFWMSIVGNPHVVETVIGLILGALAWLTTFRLLKKAASWFH